MSRKGGVVSSAAAIALGAAMAPAALAVAPRAQLRGFTCHRSVAPRERYVAVTAVMRPLPQTTKMRLRFELLRRTQPGAGFSEVSGGDLGRWKSPPDPTLGQHPDDVWRVKKPVFNLLAPASYRFRVTFRWSGYGDRTLSQAVRLSPICYQT